MNDGEAKAWVDELQAKLAADPPENIIAGLANLVMMRRKFQSDKLYHAVMRTMALALAARVLKDE